MGYLKSSKILNVPTLTLELHIKLNQHTEEHCTLKVGGKQILSTKIEEDF